MRRRGAAVATLLGLSLLVPLQQQQAPAMAQPSAGEVAAQRAEADRLKAVAGAQEDEAEQARAELAELAAASGAALEDYQLAQQALEDARADHWVQSEQLTMATDVAKRSRGELGRWATQAYRDSDLGPGYQTVAAVLDADSADDLSLRLIALGRLGRSQTALLADAESAEQRQAEAAARAARTAKATVELAAAADAARLESERLVQRQREQVAVLEAALAHSQDAAAQAEAEATRLAQARAIAEERRLAEERRVADEQRVARGLASPANAVTGPTGACAGRDVSGYPNGAIPSSALCPIWGAPGHLLRADAAHAFDALSTAYAEAHGEPLCVTDAYRSLASQVQLYATKPALAAKPGTSNHGWGKAVDLCGGVQRFGTPQHAWMVENAPLFGWFLPRWAQQGGSKPEPWHWEFGG